MCFYIFGLIILKYLLFYSVKTCSATENSELFYSIPWSYGTLGFLVSVELQIIPCLPYVDLLYVPFSNKNDALQRFEKESREQKYDFVECLAYNPNEFILMLGNLSDGKATPNSNSVLPVNNLGYWYKEWFFKYCYHFIESKKEHRELGPLRQYYHRHSKSLFWEIQDIVPFGNNVIFRYLFGWMMPPKVSLLKLTQTEAIRKLYELHHVVQDMLVPLKDTGISLDVFEKEVNVYPLWLCPFKIPGNAASGILAEDGGFIHPLEGGDEFFVDIGAYGNPTVKSFEANATIRRLEEFVRSVKGYQMLYADCYMTE